MMDRFSSLPWTPLYTQSGEATSDTNNDDPMYYYAVAVTIAFTFVVYAFESYLDSRQWVAYTVTEFPPTLAQTVGAIDAQTKKKSGSESKTNDGDDEVLLLPQLQKKFTEAQAYGLDKIRFGMIAALFDIVENTCFIVLGFMPYVWDKSVQIAASFGWTSEIGISLVFMGIVTIVGTITSLPFDLYSTFCIEQKHGFNQMTLGLFVTDKLKSLALTAVIGSPVLATLIWIIQKGGPYFYLYVWAFLFCFSVAMMTIVPVFIMPLFNKYEPLPEGELKNQIVALAERIKYPLTKLFVMDGSKRSSHSNAFMFGFGKHKRIVLFDTLLKQVQQLEILGILGHELGHWKLGHTLTNFFTTQLYFGAAFYSFAIVYQSRAIPAAFGFDQPDASVPTLIALLLFFQTVWAPVDKVLNCILTVVSRQNEFAADKFSVDLGYAVPLQSGLCKIHVENLGALRPDPWYSAYHYSHPPLVERLQAMMQLEAKMK